MTEPVIYETLAAGNGKAIGVATLNAEKKLNSLNLDMVMSLLERLPRWEQDDSISCIWLQGAGERAFCAGGDVLWLREQMLKPRDQALPGLQSFFENEYRLDYLIHRYRKPILCWGQGIVMGGGTGLMSGASHRIVTEASRIAMPEISIGLYPDVGGTWFLNHAPGRTGLFLGLTGANFNAADALFVGMADRFVASEHKQALQDSLCQQEWSDSLAQNHSLVNNLLRRFEEKGQLPASKVREHYDLIQDLTDGDTAPQVVDNILSLDTDDAWLQKAAATLKGGCPTSAHLVFQQRVRGSKLSLPEVFQMELVMALQCGLHPDFKEGVRALLVDKDGAPNWTYPSVAEVEPGWVEEHFVPPWPDGVNPLQDLGKP
ncbi:MAG: enoyl-CoA hydratase/isomerase family protein [Pseudomonadota bacterium]|nr:enoyl-CoA hydratase/isomerase family protein [Pseudomonadota bacterium]